MQLLLNNKVKVIHASNPLQVGIEGRVIWQTQKMIHILRNDKKVSKINKDVFFELGQKIIWGKYIQKLLKKFSFSYVG